MFRRLKNLWKLSNYEISEDVQLTMRGDVAHKFKLKEPNGPTDVVEVTPIKRLATIIEMRPQDPFEDLPTQDTFDETPQRPPEDSSTGDR